MDEGGRYSHSFPAFCPKFWLRASRSLVAAAICMRYGFSILTRLILAFAPLNPSQKAGTEGYFVILPIYIRFLKIHVRLKFPLQLQLQLQLGMFYHLHLFTMHNIFCLRTIRIPSCKTKKNGIESTGELKIGWLSQHLY